MCTFDLEILLERALTDQPCYLDITEENDTMAQDHYLQNGASQDEIDRRLDTGQSPVFRGGALHAANRCTICKAVGCDCPPDADIAY